MKSLMKTVCGVALLLFASMPAQAHRQWLLPSATVLSGDDPWVTVDAAVSNELFYFDHQPLRLDGLVVTAPDGTNVAIEHAATGRYRSTFDVKLTQPGTYRIALVNQFLFAQWMENGTRKRWRGTAERFAAEVPAEAKELRVTQAQNRVESLVTRGAPSTTALQPTGTGLELAPVTHPNDLVAGEAARFTLLLDGKPAAGVKVAVVRGGIRYRDKLDEVAVTTDAEGRFSVTWPEPGMYWINATVQDDKATVPQATRRSAYSGTVEVLPK